MTRERMRVASVSAAFLLVVGLLASGCGGGGGMSEQEVQQAIDQGNTSLDTAMSTFSAGSPGTDFGGAYSASESDLAAARSEFERALQGDPDNQQANLGMALVGLLMLAGDTNETYGIQDMVTQSPGGLLSRQWKPGRLLTRRSLLLRLANRQGQPTIMDLQNHIESQVIPRLEQIVARLENVTDENLQIRIPPQPAPGSPDRYVLLDYGDVLLLRAVVYQVLDLAHSTVVYHLDPGTFYDGEPSPPDLDADPDDGVLTPAEFLPLDPFLTLRGNGVSHSQAALGAERLAMSNLIAGIDFMVAEHEAGTEDHELIPVGTDPGEADPADLQRLKSVAAVLARVLDGQTSVSNTELDPTATPVVEAVINLPAFATNPPPDLKVLVPDLTYAQDPITQEYHVSGMGALPDPTFGGLLPEGLPAAVAVALVKR